MEAVGFAQVRYTAGTRPRMDASEALLPRTGFHCHTVDKSIELPRIVVCLPLSGQLVLVKEARKLHS